MGKEINNSSRRNTKTKSKSVGRNGGTERNRAKWNSDSAPSGKDVSSPGSHALHFHQARWREINESLASLQPLVHVDPCNLSPLGLCQPEKKGRSKHTKHVVHFRNVQWHHFIRKKKTKQNKIDSVVKPQTKKNEIWRNPVDPSLQDEGVDRAQF